MEAAFPRNAFRAVPFLVFALTVPLFLFPGLARGGQVVTGEDRARARTAVAEERALGAAPAGNTVGVLYFRNATGQPRLDPLQKGLALMLITDLSQVPGLQVVERVRLQALAEELGFGASGLVDPGAAPRVGRLLRAKWLVEGEIGAEQPNLLAARGSVLDVPSSEVVGRPEAGGDLDAIFRVEKDLLFGIVGTLKIEVSPEVRKRLEKPCATKAGALLALARGVDESDRGNYGKAAEQYEAALQEDPGVCLAAENLDELRVRGLIPPRKGRDDARSTLDELKDRTSITDQIDPKDPVRRGLTPKGFYDFFRRQERLP